MFFSNDIIDVIYSSVSGIETDINRSLFILLPEQTTTHNDVLILILNV